MKRTKIITIMLTLLFSLFVLENVTSAAQWQDYPERQIHYPKKSFTITFSQDVEPETVTDENIYVHNNLQQKIPVKVELKKNIVTVTPTEPYKVGDYFLYFTDGLKSINGTNFKNTRFSFTIAPTIYSDSFEVENTVNKQIELDIPSGGHYVVYNEYGKLRYAGVDSSTAYLESKDKMILSFIEPFANKLVYDNAAVKETDVPAFLSQKMSKGESFEFVNTSDARSKFFVIEGSRDVKFSLADYDNLGHSYFFLLNTNTDYNGIKEISPSEQGSVVLSTISEGVIQVLTPTLVSSIKTINEHAVNSYTLQPGEHVVVTNQNATADTKINVKQQQDALGYFEYAMYFDEDYAHANKGTTFYERTLEVTKGQKTLMTNSGDEPITIFGPAKHTQFTSSTKPALVNYVLKPNQGVQVTNSGTSKLRTELKIQEHKSELEKGRYSIAVYEESGVGHAKEDSTSTIPKSEDVYQNGTTIVTNSSNVDITVYGPAEYTQLTETKEAALEMVILSPGESVEVTNFNYPHSRSSVYINGMIGKLERGSFSYEIHQEDGTKSQSEGKLHLIGSSIDVHTSGKTIITNTGEETFTIYGAKRFTSITKK